MTTQININDISLKEQVMTKIKLGQRWFGKKEAAEYYNIKPTTINKYISLYGHDSHIIWTKLHGKVLIDIFETDRKITNGN